MKTNKLVLLLGIFAAIGISKAQNLHQDKIIARVGGSPIYESEFSQRFELSPQLVRQARMNMTPFKYNLIYSLVAEKAWAKKALEEKYDTLAETRYSLDGMKKMFVRDALYKKEIADRVNLTGPEITEGLERNKRICLIKYLYFRTTDDAGKAFKELKNGTKFETVFSEMPDSLKNSTEIKYGEQNEAVENAVFRLKTGEFSDPLKTPQGAYIYYLSGAKPNGTDLSTSYERVKLTVKRRKEDPLMQEYMRNFFKDKRVQTNGRLLKSVTDRLVKIFQDKKKSDQNKNAPKLYFSANDVFAVEHYLGPDTLDMTFIKFPYEQMSLEKFLREFLLLGFSTTEPSRDSVFHSFNSGVRTFIEREMLSHQGFELGLDKLPEVQKGYGMWRDNLLYQAYTHDHPDSASFWASFNSDSLAHADPGTRKKFETTITYRTAALAKKYDVSIDFNAVDKIEVTPINSIVYRMFGFGGKTSATPLLPNVTSWVEFWQNGKELLP